MDARLPAWKLVQPRRWLSMLGAAGLLGCGDSGAHDDGTEPPSLIEACGPEAVEVLETGSLIYRSYGRGFQGICPGSFEAAQAHAAWIEQIWGRPRVGDELRLYASREEPCWPCTSGALACVEERVAHALTVPHRHELTHLVRDRCPSLIEEGFASIYGRYFSYFETVDEIENAITVSDEGTLPGTYYGIGGAFVAFLISRDGMESLHQLCGLDIPNTLSLAEGLEEVYQLPLNELIAEFEAAPRKGNAYLKQELACDALAAGAELEVFTSPSAWTMDMGCGAPDVEGGLGQYTMAQRLIELPTDGPYTLEMLADHDYRIQVEVRHCERENMASLLYATEFVPLVAEEPRELIFDHLTAGTYVLRVRTDEDSEGNNGPGQGELAVGFSLDSWP